MNLYKEKDLSKSCHFMSKGSAGETTWTCPALFGAGVPDCTKLLWQLCIRLVNCLMERRRRWTWTAERESLYVVSDMYCWVLRAQCFKFCEKCDWPFQIYKEVLNMNSLKLFRKQQLHSFFLWEVVSSLITGYDDRWLKIFLSGHRKILT